MGSEPSSADAKIERLPTLDQNALLFLDTTDALNLLCADGNVCAYDFEGYRYDMGSKAGAVQATISFALKHPETKAETEAFIKSLKL